MIKTIISSELPVGEQFLVKKNVLTNGKGGKRICIVTGTHGDELEGQMVCYEVCKTIRENIELLDGTVEIYPALNPLYIDFACLEPRECHVHLGKREPVLRAEAEQVFVLREFHKARNSQQHSFTPLNRQQRCRWRCSGWSRARRSGCCHR